MACVLPPEIVMEIFKGATDATTMKAIRLTSFFGKVCVDKHKLFSVLVLNRSREHFVNKLLHMKELDLLKYVRTVEICSSAYFPEETFLSNSSKNNGDDGRTSPSSTAQREFWGNFDTIDFGKVYRPLISKLFSELLQSSVVPPKLRLIVTLDEDQDGMIRRLSSSNHPRREMSPQSIKFLFWGFEIGFYGPLHEYLLELFTPGGIDEQKSIKFDEVIFMEPGSRYKSWPEDDIPGESIFQKAFAVGAGRKYHLNIVQHKSMQRIFIYRMQR